MNYNNNQIKYSIDIQANEQDSQLMKFAKKLMRRKARREFNKQLRSGRFQDRKNNILRRGMHVRVIEGNK